MKIIKAIFVSAFVLLLSHPARGVDPAFVHVAAAPVWDQDLGALIIGQPYLQAESAVVAVDEGSVRSFFMTGTPLWIFSADEQVTPYIARSVEGVSYLCSSEGIFRAINRVGRELWRVDLGRPISHPPVVGWDGRVFIPVGSLLACRTAAGRQLWTIDLESPMATIPQLDRAGSLAVVLENRDFVRVSQFSAVERIRLNEQPLMIVSLKYDDEDSYILFYPNGQTEKIRFSEEAARGSKLSRESFPSLPAAPAAAASATGRSEHFAVTLRDGRVLYMNASGQVLWTGDSHETASERGSANLNHNRTSMIFDDRGIYTITTRGVTGFAPDGRRRLIFRMNEANSVPALSDEGLLYVGGTDRLIRNYKIDSKPRTVARSRYYGPEPEGNYGMGNPPPSPWFTDNWRFNEEEQDRMFNLIERAIESGQLGEREPVYVAYLMEMIGFFLNDPHYSRARPAVRPPRHIDFIRLLGMVGSRETIPFLYTIFDRYHDPTVKAGCAEAIGRIGVDPYGNAFESYRFLLAANNPHRDPTLLMAATLSIAALSRFSGPPLSGDGIVLLRFFSNLPWPSNNIKSQIQMELDALRREGLDQIMR